MRASSHINLYTGRRLTGTSAGIGDLFVCQYNFNEDSVLRRSPFNCHERPPSSGKGAFDFNYQPS